MQHGPHATAWQTVTRAGVLVALSLIVAMLLPTTANAQERLDLESLGVDVEVGFNGLHLRGRWTPVTVSVSPTRLFAGTVGVIANTPNGNLVESREVEVPAGSTKIYRFLMPPANDVTVQVVEPGTDGATLRPDSQPPQAFLVGVLGEDLPASLPPVSSVPLGERGDFTAVAPEWLDRSSRALDSLSTLVVTPEQLSTLPDRARAALVTAVGAGLDLVVTTTAAGTLDLGLPWESALTATAATIPAASGRSAPARLLEPAPGAWALTVDDLGYGDEAPTPTETTETTADGEPATSAPASFLGERDRTTALATATNAGRGRLLVTGVALGEGELGGDGAFWGQVLQPTVDSAQNFEQERGSQLGQVAGEGLRSDSFSLPPLPLIVAFLAIYLIAVGPLNGFVLARAGRRELAWLTIPAMTVVFSAGAFLASSGAESGTGLSGRAAYWVDGAGTEVSAVALRAPRPGDHELGLPGGEWDVMPGSWTNFPVEVDRRSGDTVLRTDLEALQVGTAIGFRDVAEDAPLSLDLDPIPGGVRATVTNRTAGTLNDVRVRAGTVHEDLRDLASGETATTDLTAEVLPVVRDWNDNFAGLREADGSVLAPRSLEALLRFSVLDGNPGVVWATASTDGDVGLEPPTADGDRTEDQGSFVAVGVTPGSLGSDTLPWEVDRDFVTTGFGNGWRPGPMAVEGRLEAVLRYRFPYEGTPGSIVASLDRGELQGSFEAVDVGVAFGRDLVCESVERRDDEGNLVSVQEVCGPRDADTGELLPPDELQAPECPPEASSCEFDGRSWTFCFPNGVCEGGEVMGPDGIGQARGAEGLEVYDFLAAAWTPVADAFADEAGDTLRFLSPLGESYVRVVGELHPFDYSGRGLQIVNGDV